MKELLLSASQGILGGERFTLSFFMIQIPSVRSLLLRSLYSKNFPQQTEDDHSKGFGFYNLSGTLIHPKSHSSRDNRRDPQDRLPSHDHAPPPERFHMQVVGIVSLIDMWIRLVRYGFTKELAQRLPAVTEVVLQQPLFRHHLPHMRVVVDEALPQRRSILPVPSAVVAQHEDDGVGVSEESLKGRGFYV